MRCGASGPSRRRCPCEGENGDSVVGAGNDGPGGGGRIKLHELVCARCGGDEVRECGEKRIADVDSGAISNGREHEADAASLGRSLGIHTHLQGVYDTRVEGLELGDTTVAAILLRVVHIAHRVVADNGAQRGVREAEWRDYHLRSSICETRESGE